MKAQYRPVGRRRIREAATRPPITPQGIKYKRDKPRPTPARQLISLFKALEGSGAGGTIEGTRRLAAVENQIQRRALGLP